AAVPASAQLASDANEPDASAPGAPPPSIDAEHDEFLRQVKAAASPTPEQWTAIQSRYSLFRSEQRAAMRGIRKAVMGDLARPAAGERPKPPTPEQRSEIDKQVAAKIDPMSEAMLGDIRQILPKEQRAGFDDAAKGIDLSPPRGPGADGGPGGRGPRSESSGPSAPLPPNKVTIEVKDGIRTIVSNGIPDHKPGKFPGRGNPNTISAQSYTFQMTTSPKVNDKPTPQRGLLAGVALNGVVFDPGTAEMWKNDPASGWRQEAISPMTIAGDKMGLDASNAHVQPTGAYHYHAAPEGLIEEQCKTKGVKDGEAMILLGWSADGFPIYDHHCYAKADDARSPLKELHSSYKLKKVQRPGENASPAGPGGAYDGTYTQDFEYVAGSGDLDECNGRFGVTPEFPGGTYYYVITGEFPFVSRTFRGTPDRSFAKHDRPPGAGGNRADRSRPSDR